MLQKKGDAEFTGVGDNLSAPVLSKAFERIYSISPCEFRRDLHEVSV
jgi:hypothetical protein